QHVLELLGLRQRPREAVEDEALVDEAVLGEALLDDPEGEIVGHEITPVHVLLRLAPGRRPGGGGGPEQVAGRDVLDAVPLRETGGLCALPGALLAEQDESGTSAHRRTPIRRGSPRSCASSAGCRSASWSRARRPR